MKATTAEITEVLAMFGDRASIDVSGRRNLDIEKLYRVEASGFITVHETDVMSYSCDITLTDSGRRHLSQPPAFSIRSILASLSAKFG